MTDYQKNPSSFRDPSGFVFLKNGSLYRQINLSYQENYEALMNSGLYKNLVTQEKLIPHQEVNIKSPKPDQVYKIIKPELIPFISYPYEWSFSQLKDAALLTLQIQKESLKLNLSLKDCSAYNIQFRNCQPIFIDILSFEKYLEGHPWVAYRQFCQHFLAPLALMSYRDVRLNQLLRIYLDGLPLDLTSSLLPGRTRFNFALLTHLHLHAKSQQHFAKKTVSVKGRKMSRFAFLSLLENLENTIKKLKWEPRGTEWAEYYEEINYSPEALEHKKELIAQFLKQIKPKNVWDLGANIGLFSQISAQEGISTIAFDIDPAAVEKNYLECKKKKRKNILPLLVDLTNPSPSIGWENQERMSLIERGPAEMLMALALIHHLVISNNTPLNKIASFFHRLGRWLIIEFIPKSDSQIQRLLANREDIFFNYQQENFEKEFQQYFVIKEAINIKSSKRTLYLMKKIDNP